MPLEHEPCWTCWLSSGSLPAKLEFQHKTVVGGPDYNLHFEFELHHHGYLLLVAQHSLLPAYYLCIHLMSHVSKRRFFLQRQKSKETALGDLSRMFCYFWKRWRLNRAQRAFWEKVIFTSLFCHFHTSHGYITWLYVMLDHPGAIRVPTGAPK